MKNISINLCARRKKSISRRSPISRGTVILRDWRGGRPEPATGRRAQGTGFVTEGTGFVTPYMGEGRVCGRQRQLMKDWKMKRPQRLRLFDLRSLPPSAGRLLRPSSAVALLRRMERTGRLLMWRSGVPEFREPFCTTLHYFAPLCTIFAEVRAPDQHQSLGSVRRSEPPNTRTARKF